MSKEPRWQQVTELLNNALDLPAEDRPRYLRQACGNDETLHGRVEALLAAYEGAGDFLGKPVFSLRQGDGTEKSDMGRRIGPYRLQRRLGQGGMGEVFLAERVDGGFEQRVAVKLLKRGLDSDEILRRFQVERQILARLTHPNVAQLLDGGTTRDGAPYFVMEYVDGQPIDEYCDARRLGTRERVRLFRSVCAGVHFAHRNLVVHRDLKPGNVLVSTDGRPKLLDFGVAKLLRNDPRFFAPSGGAGGEDLATATLQMAPVTLPYASPEQIQGGPITTATDVYALGVMLYELLTGHRPQRFEKLTPQRIAEVVCEQTPPRPSSAVRRTEEIRDEDGAPHTLTPESVSRVRDGGPKRLRRQLAGDLDNIVMMALRKEPERRFSSVEQLSEDLRRYLEGLPVRSRADTLAYRTGKFVRRHAWGVAAVGAIAALVLVFVTSRTIQGTKIARQNEEIIRQNEEITRERDRARTVTDFLVEFLKAPEPGCARGRSLTVQEALDAAVTRLATELQSEPEVRAAVLDAIGGVYRNLALYDEAKPLLEEALALRLTNLGEQHPLVAESLHNLANLERNLGGDERPEDLMRRAIAIQRKAFPEGHRDLARGLNNLASLLLRRRQMEQAESFAREALEMKLRVFGEEHLDVATSLNTLASLARAKGELDEAEELYRRSIAVRRKVGEAIDPGLASTLNNLAGLLMTKGDPEASLTLHEEALQIRRQLYRGDHTELASSLNNLAVLHTLRGEPEKALPLLEEALRMERGLSGESSLRLAVFRKNRALALSEAGDDVECETMIGKALPILRQRAGPARVAEAESIRGACLAGQGRFDEAEQVLLSSHRTLSELLGEEARQTRLARDRIAEAHAARELRADL